MVKKSVTTIDFESQTWKVKANYCNYFSDSGTTCVTMYIKCL
jgi:hypothetical protein